MPCRSDRLVCGFKLHFPRQWTTQPDSQCAASAVDSAGGIRATRARVHMLAGATNVRGQMCNITSVLCNMCGS